MRGVLSRGVNRRIGRAMHTYNMIEEGDSILLAVSGGVDSLVLAWVLDFWRNKAPVNYEIQALHIDMEPNEEFPGVLAGKVQEQLEQFRVPSCVVPAAWQPPDMSSSSENSSKDVCYHCSSSRRKQLFDFARREGCNKVAFGHHQDDIIETFFINLCYSGNISTMVPRQDLFDGRLSLIRPLSFLNKEDILDIAQALNITPVRTSCPLSEKTRRMDVRNVLGHLYEAIPDAKSRIFAAMSNVRHDYLLKPPKGR